MTGVNSYQLNRISFSSVNARPLNEVEYLIGARVSQSYRANLTNSQEKETRYVCKATNSSELIDVYFSTKSTARFNVMNSFLKDSISVETRFIWTI